MARGRLRATKRRLERAGHIGPNRLGRFALRAEQRQHRIKTENEKRQRGF